MLTLSEDQGLLRDSLDDFFDPEAAITSLRQGESGGAHWQAAAELGLAGLFAPEEIGGNGFGVGGAAVVAEALGRSLARLPFLGSGVLGPILLRSSSVGAASGWLADIACGRARFALAIDENDRHEPQHITARYANGKLTADKSFVLDGAAADLIGVVARDDSAQLVVAVIERQAIPEAIQPYGLIDGTSAACVRLSCVAARQVAAAGELSVALDIGRAVLAAELLGLAAALESRTLEYLRTRIQFGRAIGSFQALQHRLAHLHTEIEMTRSAVRGAVEALDEQLPQAHELALIAKAKAARIANFAASEALQLHGGIGMTAELDIGYFMKRAAVAASTLGDEAWCADQLARLWNLS